MRNSYEFYHNTCMNLTSTYFFLFDITATIAVLVVEKIVGENKQTVQTKRGNILIEKENITAAAVEIKCTMIMKMMMVILFPWM